MGTLSMSKAGRLFWLGRYSERVYTSLRAVKPLLDAEIDGKPADYPGYCSRLGLPCRYDSTEDFCRQYLCGDDPNSVLAALRCAYDNAIVLRDTIGTDTLAYIQLALNAMELAGKSDAPAVALQWVEDDIMAFRGSCYETIDDEAGRSILRTGISMERLDLYLRLGYPREVVHREFNKLFDRLYKTHLRTDPQHLQALVDGILDSDAPQLSDRELLAHLEALFPDL